MPERFLPRVSGSLPPCCHPLIRGAEELRRVGVPLYVLYPAADQEKPIVLPELLTESILLNALRKLP